MLFYITLKLKMETHSNKQLFNFTAKHLLHAQKVLKIKAKLILTAFIFFLNATNFYKSNFLQLYCYASVFSPENVMLFLLLKSQCSSYQHVA